MRQTLTIVQHFEYSYKQSTQDTQDGQNEESTEGSQEGFQGHYEA